MSVPSTQALDPCQPSGGFYQRSAQVLRTSLSLCDWDPAFIARRCVAVPTQIGYNHRTVTYSPFRCRSQERRFHHSSRANPSPTTPPSTRLHSDWWFWLRYGFTQLFVQGSNYSFKGNSHRTDVCPLNSGVRPTSCNR